MYHCFLFFLKIPQKHKIPASPLSSFFTSFVQWKYVSHICNLKFLVATLKKKRKKETGGINFIQVFEVTNVFALTAPLSSE